MITITLNKVEYPTKSSFEFMRKPIIKNIKITLTKNEIINEEPPLKKVKRTIKDYYN
jgi:hypothetical protein